MDVHPIKNVSIGIDPYPYEGKGLTTWATFFPENWDVNHMQKWKSG
jgi:hypothetical protein